ncbi:hypothetical protein ABT269_28435 [Streptomyces viridosporus]|uniref:hypothetical protein n=1 Tax=Streptomyces viridosporus TaxID=67581 RepID=UPI00331A0324
MRTPRTNALSHDPAAALLAGGRTVADAPERFGPAGPSATGRYAVRGWRAFG